MKDFELCVYQWNNAVRSNFPQDELPVAEGAILSAHYAGPRKTQHSGIEFRVGRSTRNRYYYLLTITLLHDLAGNVAEASLYMNRVRRNRLAGFFSIGCRYC